jgi:hypothetical protein
MNVNYKLMKRALKEINFAVEWETQGKQDEEIEFWLEYMYHQGAIDFIKREGLVNE